MYRKHKKEQKASLEHWVWNRRIEPETDSTRKRNLACCSKTEALLKICPEDRKNVEYGNYCVEIIMGGQVVGLLQQAGL